MNNHSASLGLFLSADCTDYADETTVLPKRNGLSLLKEKIGNLADEYAGNLKSKTIARKKEMEDDGNSHYLIYRVLGIPHKEGKLIDEYQNTGRFLYKYAGSFLEEAATLCIFF